MDKSYSPSEREARRLWIGRGDTTAWRRENRDEASRSKSRNTDSTGWGCVPKTHHGWRRWLSIVFTTLRRAVSSPQRRSIFLTALMTVEWSLPPNRLPISG